MGGLGDAPDEEDDAQDSSGERVMGSVADQRLAAAVDAPDAQDQDGGAVTQGGGAGLDIALHFVQVVLLFHGGCPPL